MTISSMNRKVRASVFEGLFLHGVRQSAELAALLRGHGFDGARMEAEYPALVFNLCLEAARQHFHAGLPMADGYRALGETQVAGLAQTLVGKVVLATITVISPSRLMKLMPRLFQVDSTPVQVAPTERAPGSWVVAFVGDPTMQPDYISGIISGLLLSKKVSARCRARATGPGDFEVDVTWT